MFIKDFKHKIEMGNMTNVILSNVAPPNKMCFMRMNEILLLFFRKKTFIISDLLSRVNNLVSYNLPDSYLCIPLSIFPINNMLGESIMMSQ